MSTLYRPSQGHAFNLSYSLGRPRSLGSQIRQIESLSKYVQVRVRYHESTEWVGTCLHASPCTLHRELGPKAPTWICFGLLDPDWAAPLFCRSPRPQTKIYQDSEMLSCKLCRVKEQISEAPTARLEQEGIARIRYQVVREGAHGRQRVRSRESQLIPERVWPWSCKSISCEVPCKQLNPTDNDPPLEFPNEHLFVQRGQEPRKPKLSNGAAT